MSEEGRDAGDDRNTTSEEGGNVGDDRCYGPVLDRNGRHSTRHFTDTYRDTDPALA